MKLARLAALLAIFQLAACSHIVNVSSEKAVNEAAAGRDVTVHYTDNTSQVVGGFHVQGDSAAWRGYAVPLTRISSARIDLPWADRALLGAVGGFMVGGLIGGAYGSTTMTGEDVGLGFYIGAIVGGAPSAIAGFIIGKNSATTVVYTPAPPGTPSPAGN
jgi:hypothetical protein